MSNPNQMEGRIALVTGGASGIGAATAALLARRGATVVIADLNIEEDTRAGKPVGLKIDVAESPSVEIAVDKIINAYGRLDCVVHSAGIARTVPFFDTTLEQFDQIMGVNVRGTFVVGQIAARAMRETGGGSIVNIGSVSGILGSALRIAYGTSKAAVHHLTKVMAVELGPYNIRVNAVAPGPVSTPMTDAMYTDAVRKEWTERMPLGRFGSPEDMASAAVYLVSDEASFITGHVLVLDGGFTIKGLSTNS
ncbi:3-oxoacyl-(acyl-carrier-protein) reductase FabG [Agrobacterium fabacearum CFBP 5771]|jgi:3-oxoacyl-[acyl-carrier protein] reductase|uniref:SDR family oxidoreductase n=2 Tax=Agrobacterium tumefaciens complex TaxID=1183400 RepID=A0A4D7YW01_AGRTU|nr:SDR family oxidoreductase [Agrobacterium tumefaciens]QCL98196.1 SDR family oxidoreductase [Agrobacterium tumefaciens]CVI24805.1 3-oxoacyl-(acyl-carrier-protein) reductase FabG [Agrobacterium fabacearum CFBP 5771]